MGEYPHAWELIQSVLLFAIYVRMMFPPASRKPPK